MEDQLSPRGPWCSSWGDLLDGSLRDELSPKTPGSSDMFRSLSTVGLNEVRVGDVDMAHKMPHMSYI